MIQKNSVGIITFTYGNNYGQRLQNIAMQEFLRKYFKEVYTIKQEEPYVSPIGIIKRVSKNILKGEYITLLKRGKKFKEFDLHISFFDIPIGKDNLDSFPEKKFDYFVVGSDQVWSPYSPDVNESMFLTFTNYEKRIAIAPSLACEEIPNNLIEKFSNYFNGIKYISTREYKGSFLVSNIIKRKVSTIIDPTLMFDASFWAKYENKPRHKLPDKYCLIYCLGNYENDNHINAICRNLKLETINMMEEKYYKAMGPGEFLYLIKKSSLVVTDSYHGTIFSYIYRVPFLNFFRKGSGIDMNSRFDTLYRKFNIEPRFLGEIDDDKILDIDFNHIAVNIEIEREKFINFVEDALYEIGEL